MGRVSSLDVARRERQVLETVSRLRAATVAEVQAELADDVSYDAVRGMLRVLREKGLVKCGRLGKRYVYRPSVSPQKTRIDALRHLVRTFFDGSRASTMAALLRDDASAMTEEEFDRLKAMVEEASARRRAE